MFTHGKRCFCTFGSSPGMVEPRCSIKLWRLIKICVTFFPCFHWSILQPVSWYKSYYVSFFLIQNQFGLVSLIYWTLLLGKIVWSHLVMLLSPTAVYKHGDDILSILSCVNHCWVRDDDDVFLGANATDATHIYIYVDGLKIVWWRMHRVAFNKRYWKHGHSHWKCRTMGLSVVDGMNCNITAGYCQWPRLLFMIFYILSAVDL